MPPSSQAPEPSSSFSSGIPNRSTARTPSAASSPASRTISSTERCAIPSSPVTGRTTPSPGHANSGITTSSSDSRVSRTSARSVSVRRRRRRRVTGKPLIRQGYVSRDVVGSSADSSSVRWPVVVPGSRDCTRSAKNSQIARAAAIVGSASRTPAMPYSSPPASRPKMTRSGCRRSAFAITFGTTM